MEHGRLSSLFWLQLDRGSGSQQDTLDRNGTATNGESSATLSVSEWNTLTTTLVNAVQGKSQEKALADILFAYWRLVKKNRKCRLCGNLVRFTAD